MDFENSEEEDIPLTPMQTDMVWALEEVLIDIYNLLVHRIQGIGLSLKDFYEMDTWTISKLYLTELELIEKEEKEYGKGNKGKSSVYEDGNDEEVDELYVELFGDE